MDPSRQQGTHKFVTEQDLISKLDDDARNPARNLNSQVDCTLKLGLPSSQSKPQHAAASSQQGQLDED
ncbi:hypothetical protein FRX31_020283 [Thalictrum thalictroides]|uniref:Uncharacterized protein n=1 Tax=Thalictrum thalictroides TaxID=46969 RepID=A0A7J6VYC8_THATH|nr:hypothetical protein FRX31_020283 [Thalictrum thalictroides]